MTRLNAGLDLASQNATTEFSVPGTALSLTYSGHRVRGYHDSHMITLPLTGDTVPESAKRVELEAEVAGQRHTATYEPEPNTEHTLHWNGKDAYGRAVAGTQWVDYRVGYVFDATYRPPGSSGRSFGGQGQAGSGNEDDTRTVVREYTEWASVDGQRQNISVSALDDRSRGLGGWALDVRHDFDPVAEVVHRGDGGRRRVATVDQQGGQRVGPRAVAGIDPDRRLGLADLFTLDQDGVPLVPDGSVVRRLPRDGEASLVVGLDDGRYPINDRTEPIEGAPALGTPFLGIEDVAVADDGTRYLTSGDNRIYSVDTEGNIGIVAGAGNVGYSGDGGPATDARLEDPQGIVVTDDDTLFFADSQNNVVRRITPDGIIDTVAGNGNQDYAGDGGPATEASFGDPVALELDGEDVLVSDNATSTIRRFTPGGTIETVAGGKGRGYEGDGGSATAAKLHSPNGISLADDGTLYIADSGNAVIRAVAPDGTIDTVAGTGTQGYDGNGEQATAAKFFYPTGVAATDDGGFYIIDGAVASLRYVDDGGSVSWVAGFTEEIWESFSAEQQETATDLTYSLTTGGDGGPATRASFNRVSDVATTADGTIYVTEEQGQVVRAVAPDGTIDTIAGTGDRGYTGDGGPATQATFDDPISLAVDENDGSIYVADRDNGVVRRIRPDGTIETAAGDGTFEYAGDGGPATEASLNGLRSVAVDVDGNLFIATNERIRRVGTDGTIRTIAGGGTDGVNRFNWQSNSGSQQATDFFLSPADVAVDANGNVFLCVSDQVFRVDPGGALHLIAGTGERGSEDRALNVPATEADLIQPYSVDVGPNGLVFIAERGPYASGMVLVVDNSGVIGTLVDPSELPRSQHPINTPVGVSVGPDGSLYVADSLASLVYRLLDNVDSADKTLVPASDGSEVYEFAFGGRHLRTYDGLTGDVQWAFSYDEEQRLVGITDPQGTETTIERDANGAATAIVAPDGRRTALSIDGDGYLQSIAPPAGGSVECAYDSNGEGRLKTATHRDGETTDYTYAAVGRATEMTDRRNGIHELARPREDEEVTLTYTLPTGDVRTYTLTRNGSEAVLSVDPGSGETRLGHDGVTQTGGGIETETTTAQDERFTVQTLYPDTVTSTWDGNTSVKESTQTATGTWNADSGIDKFVQTTTIDGTERLRATYESGSGLTFEAAGQTIEASGTDSTNGRTGRTAIPGIAPIESTVDSAGKVTSVRQSAGGTTREMSAAYDGATDEPSAMTMPTGEQYQFQRDANGALTGMTLPGGRSVSYARTASGRVETVTLPGGATHNFEWGAGGLLDVYQPPAGGELTYDYDELGRLTDLGLPTDETLLQRYDSRGRLAALETPAGTIDYSYDDTTGGLSNVSGPNGQSVGFDYAGPNLTRQTYSGPISGSISLDHTPDGRIKAVSVDGGETISRQYSGFVVSDAGDMTLHRDADHGRVTETTLDSVTDSWSFDDFGDLEERRTTAGADTLYDASHETDDAGRLTRLQETVDGTTTTWRFSYDSAGRLTEVTEDGSTAETFGYDARDNLTRRGDGSGTTSRSYDDADRIQSAGTRTYSHDAAGRLTEIDGPNGTTSLSYDVRDTLTGVSLADGTDIEYVVDPMGRRVGKHVDGSLERGWLYLDDLRPVAEVGASGSVRSQFVYARGATVPDYMIRDGTTYRLVTDRRESVRLVVDTGTGDIVQRLDYDAFGQVTTDTNPGFQPFGFAGGHYDPETGFVRFGEREYDPRIGRWTSPDPSGFQGSPLNRYAYAGNDPINARDPRGLSATAVAVLVVVGGGLIAGGTDYAIQRNTGNGQVNYWQTGIATGAGMMSAGTEGVLYSVGVNSARGVAMRAGVSVGVNGLIAGGEQVAKNCVDQSAPWFDDVWEQMGINALLNTLGPGRIGDMFEAVPSAKGIREFVKSDGAAEFLEVSGNYANDAVTSLTYGTTQTAGSSTQPSTSSADTSFSSASGGQSRLPGAHDGVQASFPPE